ncbi:MAG: hypothetical protein M3N13_03180 [Candidatus Eremiobacteraeota bacterium]|nr:hypothetical protein [Candidatus Eremiobacteraeota bacterium]
MEREEIQQAVVTFGTTLSQDYITLRADSSVLVTHCGKADRKYPLNSLLDEPTSTVTSVAITPSCRPIVTVTTSFSGAFTGQTITSYRWNSAWVAIAPSEKVTSDNNVTVDAADDDCALMNLSTQNSPGDANAYYADPVRHSQFQVALQCRSRSDPIGYGEGLAIYGTTAIGTTLQSESKRRVAWAFTRGRYRTLGKGSAWGINRFESIVGTSDEIGVGRPIVWSGSRSFWLSTKTGVAFDINDHGSIVGTLEGRAFVSTTRGSNRELRLLDDLVTDKHWQFFNAFRITNSGAIFARGRYRPKGAESMILLQPVGKQ